MPIKTFRGLLANNAIEIVPLHTSDGSIGYRIIKLELIAQSPGAVHNENVVKIYSTPQTTATAEIDFSDQELLGVGFYVQDASRIYNPSTSVVFDDRIFNQDIYITHKMVDETGLVNYYIELEQMKLDLSENTVATLKDIRNIQQPL